jgi:hypothetical protein
MTYARKFFPFPLHRELKHLSHAIIPASNVRVGTQNFAIVGTSSTVI